MSSNEINPIKKKEKEKEKGVHRTWKPSSAPRRLIHM
jgi:hypothetical protein